MVNINTDSDVFTVMVFLKSEPDLQDDLVKLSEKTAPKFADQPGFISQTMHKSHDGTSLVSYLQWRCKDDHEKCMENPDLKEAGAELMELIESGKVEMQVQTFDIAFQYENK